VCAPVILAGLASGGGRGGIGGRGLGMAVRPARWDRLDVARAMPWPGRSWPSRLIC